jgi:DnaK suppressor protein
MTEEKIAQFKKQLMDEKARLETERQQYAGPDRDQAAIENFDRMLAKVNRALQKIDEGTYGLSDIDGTPIPEARLEALPYANITVEQSEDTLEH